MDEKERKHRCFIGLSCEEEEMGSAFLDMYRKLKISGDRKELAVKWVPLKNVHLTLKFLGEIESGMIENVRESLRELSGRLAPLHLKVRGLGGFPDATESRVIWAGVQNKKTLQELQGEIESVMAKEGFPLSSQDYLPHLTLGRLRNRKNIEDLISPFVRKDFGSLALDRVTLFESHLQGNFPVYEVIESFSLTGAPSGEAQSSS